VIDVNLMPKGRKKGKKMGKKGEDEGEEERVTRAAGRENIDPPQTSAPRKRRRSGEPQSAAVGRETVTDTSRRADDSANGGHPAATLSAADSSVPISPAYSAVARAILFR
jgi:hypothetical protein